MSMPNGNIGEDWQRDSADLGRRRSVLLYLFGASCLVVFAAYSGVTVILQNQTDSRYTPRRWINLEEPATVPPRRGDSPPIARPSLRVAIAPVISPEKSLQRYHGLVDYLAGQLDRRPVFLQRETYADVNALVRRDRCDLALVCTYAFVLGEQEFGMRALVIPQVHGAITYHSLILVPRSSDAKSLMDLRAKRFASADTLSNSGWLFPATWLKSRGEDIASFFSEHIITGSHDRSVAAVTSGYVDGAAVDSLVYDQMVADDPEIAGQAKIILKSPPFGMPPIVVPAELDPALRERLLAILLQMHVHPQGRKILASLRIDRFREPEEHLFDSVREMCKIWEAP